MASGFFRGTSLDQDSRFGDGQQKLKDKLEYPEIFKHPVNTTKVKMDVMKPWISAKLIEFLGFEDEVVIGMAFNMLEEEKPDPKDMQIQLTGFLSRNAKKFMTELWTLLVSACNNPTGIPQEMLEEKKRALAAENAEKARIAAEVARKRNELLNRVGRAEGSNPRKSRWDTSQQGGEAAFDKSSVLAAVAKMSPATAVPSPATSSGDAINADKLLTSAVKVEEEKKIQKAKEEKEAGTKDAGRRERSRSPRRRERSRDRGSDRRRSRDRKRSRSRDRKRSGSRDRGKRGRERGGRDDREKDRDRDRASKRSRRSRSSDTKRDAKKDDRETSEERVLKEAAKKSLQKLKDSKEAKTAAAAAAGDK